MKPYAYVINGPTVGTIELLARSGTKFALCSVVGNLFFDVECVHCINIVIASLVSSAAKKSTAQEEFFLRR